jgi:hypothetical protein
LAKERVSGALVLRDRAKVIRDRATLALRLAVDTDAAASNPTTRADVEAATSAAVQAADDLTAAQASVDAASAGLKAVGL